MEPTKKKILFQLHAPPIPVDGGAARRVLGFLKYFRDRKDFFSVDAVASNAIGGKSWTGKEKQAVLDYVENFFIYKGEKNFIDFFYTRSKSFYNHKLLKQQMPVDSDYHVPPGYIRFVQKLISQHPYDLLWINFLNNAHLAVKSKSSAQILIDIHDIHCHTRLAKKPRFSQKLKFDYKDNFEKEVKLLNKFDTVIVNSQDELNLLKPNLLLQKLYLIPHLIESVASISNIPTYQNRKFKYDLLFVGTGGHSPNVEGIKFFLGSIFPKVVFARANVKLAIAGTVNKFVQLNESFKKNVDCLGYVPDLSDLYLQSKLVICPLLSGAGTKVKIQEAMVFGIPVVTTTVGASGMKLVNAVNAFITDEPELFAEKILHLLEKPELAQNISENIFQLFNSDYSNSAIYSKLDRMLGILSS